MSLLARRQHDAQDRRERELIDIRDSVVAAMPSFPNLGSSPISEAVDEALDQLRATGKHLAGDIDEAKSTWILYAKRRLIDCHRSAASKRRESMPVDEHTQALTVSAADDVTIAADVDRDWWRVREILSQFHGDERRWMEAWFDKVLAGETQPRGLDQALGWHQRRTESVSRRARRRMATFVDHRHSGGVCREQRDLLESYRTAAVSHAPGDVAAQLGEERYQALIFHLAGCEDCWTAWHLQRRTTVLRRVAAAITLPFGQLAGLAHAFRGKLDTLAAALHSTTFSLRQRLGLGGGAGAAVTGGGVATISGKAAAICGAVVCAAGAAGGAVVEAVPALLPATVHHAAHHAPRHAKQTAARSPQPAATVASYTAPVTAPTTQTAAAAPVKKPATTTQPSYTPGDLPPASSQQTASTSSTPQASAASTASQPGQLPSSTTSSSTPTRPVTAPRPEQHASPSCIPGNLVGC